MTIPYIGLVEVVEHTLLSSDPGQRDKDKFLQVIRESILELASREPVVKARGVAVGVGNDRDLGHSFAQQRRYKSVSGLVVGCSAFGYGAVARSWNYAHELIIYRRSTLCARHPTDLGTSPGSVAAVPGFFYSFRRTVKVSSMWNSVRCSMMRF